MKRDTVRTLGIDPGITVGWSYGSGVGRINSGELNFNSFLSWLDAWLQEGDSADGPIDRIAVEQFDMRSFTNEAKTTIEVVGTISYLARKFEVPMNFVTASARKKYRDSRIEGRHARDAESVRQWDLHHGRW